MGRPQCAASKQCTPPSLEAEPRGFDFFDDYSLRATDFDVARLPLIVDRDRLVGCPHSRRRPLGRDHVIVGLYESIEGHTVRWGFRCHRRPALQTTWFGPKLLTFTRLRGQVLQAGRLDILSLNIYRKPLNTEISCSSSPSPCSRRSHGQPETLP